MRGHDDLEVAVGSAALCAVLALALPFEALRVLLALPLTMFLSGYAISAAIFARRPLPRRQFLLLSVGLSLAVLALGTLVLNYVPGGIRAGSWALLLFLVVLGCCRGAAVRRPRGASAPVSWALPQVSAAQAGLLALGGVAAIAAIVLAFTPLAATNATGFTELWIHPLSGDNGVRIGVGSAERDDASYRLVVNFGGSREVTREVELRPGQREVLALGESAAASAPAAIPVTATLFKQDSANPDRPFRQVSTWLGPAEGGTG
ncbi:MAG TPA: DUF1616 domain-containing protein [Solirubrobacterales bacterium]|jgi:hypothetical protein|nr:DUF1616 domain-containing protein [Solirubrobacterales bacterium]